MRKQATVKEQVKSGFQLAGWTLLVLGWLGLVFGGITQAFGTEADFNEGHHPHRILGYFILVVAAAIFVATANRWKIVLPGIMVAGTFGALHELQYGHALNSPTVLIPHWISLVQLVVIASVAAVSFTLKKRPLNLVDRIALLVFAASIYVGGGEAHRQQLPVALIAGGLCVLAAWAFHRMRPQAQNGSSHHSHVIAE